MNILKKIKTKSKQETINAEEPKPSHEQPALIQGLAQCQPSTLISPSVKRNSSLIREVLDPLLESEVTSKPFQRIREQQGTMYIIVRGYTVGDITVLQLNSHPQYSYLSCESSLIPNPESVSGVTLIKVVPVGQDCGCFEAVDLLHIKSRNRR